MTDSEGTAVSATNFDVTSPVPTITSFIPSSGSAGMSVVITGTGFTGATSVTFNDVSSAFIVNSDTQITATVPANATTGRIRVTTPGGPSPPFGPVFIPDDIENRGVTTRTDRNRIVG